MKKIKSIIVILMSLIILTQGIAYGAINTTVEITKTAPSVRLDNEEERIFKVGYEFNVSYEYVVTGLDIVLVLDRSNSMLRPDPATGLPVVDAVWQAVINFAEEVYATYPESNMAIVSFGTDANKRDGWQYYDNLAEVTTEINRIYEYKNLETDYRYKFRHYRNNYYQYAWENWSIFEGATNISAAFNYSTRTVSNKIVNGIASDQDVTILFTDGVATQGGSNSQRNYNYPRSHNTNTIAAYTSGQAAQSSAEIITVGYFGGISYGATKEVARETLQLSQNAGFFEALETGHLTNIFDTIVGELNYVGTNAQVVEVIEDEFQIIENSIEPDTYTLSTDAQGRQVITWQVGNVSQKDYNFSYKVKVKDTVYPTGSGIEEIPINDDALFQYTDLNDHLVTESVGKSFTTIPARDNQPKVNVTVQYENNQYNYLIGDTIKVRHELDFVNIEPFDYRHINIYRLRRFLEEGNVKDYLSLLPISVGAGWYAEESALTKGINEEKTVASQVNLTWNKDIDVEMKALKVGTYQLHHGVVYQLTNSVGTVFDFYSQGTDLEEVNVKEGKLVLDLVDTLGNPVHAIGEVKIDEETVEVEVDGEQHKLVHPIVSGLHKVSFLLPSGYKLADHQTGITVEEGKNVVFTDRWAYATPEISKRIELERLNIKDVKIQTLSGANQAGIDQITDAVEGKVSFTLTRPLTQIGLALVDDFSGAEFEFDLHEMAQSGHVRNSEGNLVSGFTMNGNQLRYSGGALSVDTYVAYGVMTPPSNLGASLDYDYIVDVNEIVTREAGDTVDYIAPITASTLTIGVVDEEGPVIVATVDEDASTINLVHQDISITDKIQIVTYKVYQGELTYEALASNEPLAISVTENTGTQVLLNLDMPVQVVKEVGKFITKGSITIYGEDAFGNKTIHVVNYENDAIDDLLNEDII